MSPDHEGVGALVARLLDRSAGDTPDVFLERGRTERDAPGLYSWWIDGDGARELTLGLGHVVEEGLIYAGLAGATRWPSGRRSRNTLWSRIVDMHLGGNQEFSTFRLTLAAILASSWGQESVPETRLTDWMTSHLVVVAEPVADADALGRIEKDVLAAIDPPLNLQTMTPTPIRRRLKELRRALARDDGSRSAGAAGRIDMWPSEAEPDSELAQVSRLLRSRNAIDAELAGLMGRPMTSGHLGEWLASRILPIELEASATAAGIDGRFVEGPLAGRTVNVKWYLKREGLLDLSLPGPDFYLVLAGPRGSVGSSRGQTRPWCVESVYLFDAGEVLDAQRRRGVKIGIASSVPVSMWDAAEIYPRPTCSSVSLDDQQREALAALARNLLTAPPSGADLA